MKVESTTNDKSQPQRLALCVADSDFTCFDVPVKQLKPSPVRVVRDYRGSAGRGLKADDGYECCLIELEVAPCASWGTMKFKS